MRVFCIQGVTNRARRVRENGDVKSASISSV